MTENKGYVQQRHIDICTISKGFPGTAQRLLSN